MVAYIDTLRDKQWPESQPAAPRPPRTEEEKNETRERAHNLVNARCKRTPVFTSESIQLYLAADYPSKMFFLSSL